MMWMMGYNDGGEFNSTIQDPFAGRKLRPLIPRSATAAAVATSPPCFQGTDFLALNHHLAMVEQSKRELNTQQVVVSSRWNPTPEQLQTLEELYRRGTRTPSADQIQQITAQLRRYGKIEGKNVFYWFQNHKARERQKRRRQHDEQKQQLHYDKREPPPPGANRSVFEVEQAKNWVSPTNSCTVADQRGVVCTQAAAKAAAASECKADGWVHFDEEDDVAATAPSDDIIISQHRRNATWQSMDLSSSSSSSPATLINPSPAATSPLTNSGLVPSAFATVLETSKPHNQDFIDILCKPYGSRNLEEYPAQTLQLFPLHRRSCTAGEEGELEEEEDSGMNGGGCNAPPYQFFEFLPLKN